MAFFSEVGVLVIPGIFFGALGCLLTSLSDPCCSSATSTSVLGRTLGLGLRAQIHGRGRTAPPRSLVALRKGGPSKQLICQETLRITRKMPRIRPNNYEVR